MLRTIQFDDDKHEILFIRKGGSVAVETGGDENINVRAVLILRSQADVERAKTVVAVCGEMLAAWNDAPGPVCGKCGVLLTTETAEGREDGLYCDKCIEEIADKTPVPNP